MKTQLTDDEITQYRDDGFLKVENFLSAGELELWRNTIDLACNQQEERLPGFEDKGSSGDEYYDNVFRQRVNLWQNNKDVRSLITDPKIAEMAAKLEGEPAFRIWHDQALFKQAWGNPTAWHIDTPYWSFYSKHATTIWIALDDTTIQNGALYFLPGAHKTATYDNVHIDQNMGSLFDIYPDWAHIKPTCVEMKAGDASFHNGLTPHAAGPNMTTGSRRAFAIIFMPDGSTYNGNRNILPKDYWQSLSVGDPLNNDELNPLVYP